MGAWRKIDIWLVPEARSFRYTVSPGVNGVCVCRVTVGPPRRSNSITITPVVAQSVASARTSSPSVSVVRIKEEPKSPGEQQLPSCSGDSVPRAVQAPLNGTRASPSETAAGMASRSLVRDLVYLAITWSRRRLIIRIIKIRSFSALCVKK